MSESEILNALHNAIKASKQTCYAISKGSGIDQSALSRFMSGERGLSIEKAEQLARYLGVTIKIIQPKRKG